MEDFKTVTMSVESYNAIMAQAAKLQALENAGVDNWEWYGDAMEALHNEED